MLTFYVVANGALFQEGLNALVTFLGEDTFHTFLHLGLGYGFFCVFFGFVMKRDWVEVIKWYGMFVFVTVAALTPKTEVAIYDSSNPGAALYVQNFPSLLALIGNSVTNAGYGVTMAMEEAFHLPDDLSYNKTGMLFGAKMFQASHSFQILSPTLHREMDDYIQNCVIGDMRINQKYTEDEVKASRALWDLWSTSPSPVRRIAWQGGFLSCQEATPLLKTAMQNEIDQQSFPLYGKKLFGASGSSNYQALFNQYLSSSYQYFMNSSQTATDIFMQTMLINAMNEGVKDYAAMSNSSAGLQNYVAAKAEIQTRSAWMVMGEEATYFLPIMQTILLLLFVCLFPFIIVFSLFPKGFAYWTEYIKDFVWIELWPPLFAITNMAMNYSLQEQSMAFSSDGVSMNTINQLTQIHQDSAAYAGYLSLALVGLSRMLLANRVLDWGSSVASGALGMLQSNTNMAAGEATSGNFSLGNTNYHNTSANNMNANKHDTDWTDYHGTVTSQMASGVMKTVTEDGQSIYNVAPGISNLAQSLNLGSQLSSTFSESAEKAHNAAITESHNVQSSLSSAANHFVQLGNSLSQDHRDNDHASKGLSDTETKALSFLESKADEISKNESISKSEAYKVLGNMAYHLNAGVDSEKGLIGKAAGVALGVKGSASTGYSYSDSSEHSDNYTRHDSHGLSSRDVEEVSHAFHVVESHQNNQSSDISDSRSNAIIDNLSSDLHSANTASHNRDVSLSQSQRFSEMATMAQTNSASINSNMNQAFVEYVRKTEGEERADVLFSHPESVDSQIQLQALGSRFVNHVSQEMVQGNYEDFKSTINPERTFAEGQASVKTGEANILEQNQQANYEVLRHKSEFQTTNGVENEIRDNVNSHLQQMDQRATAGINQGWQEHQADKNSMEKTLDAGHVASTKWAPPSLKILKGHVLY